MSLTKEDLLQIKEIIKDENIILLKRLRENQMLENMKDRVRKIEEELLLFNADGLGDEDVLVKALIAERNNIHRIIRVISNPENL